jgi:hypothetical protein
VEDYLDAIEEVSKELLNRVVNLVTISSKPSPDTPGGIRSHDQ